MGGINEIQRKYLKIIRAYIEESGYKDGDYRRLFSPAKRLLQRCDGDVDKVLGIITEVGIWCRNRGINWSLHTVNKVMGKNYFNSQQARDIPEVIKDEGLVGLKELIKRKWEKKEQ